jgi:carboxypeptidase C (cathepsin A)
MKTTLIILLLTAFFSVRLCEAAPREDSQSSKSHNPCNPPAVSSDTIVTTQHTIKINGNELKYRADCGRLKITDSAGCPKAFIFFTSYVKQQSGGINRRPLIFAFNGGPGASSVWLHLAAAGPEIMQFGNDGTSLPETDTLINNKYTWLNFADLVFIDPVGTGFSRAVPGTNQTGFFSTDGDVALTSEFIRLYLTRFQRWNSPLYIAGESYGTTRAATLSDYLQNNKSIVIEGLILISSVLNFSTISFDNGNDIAYALAVPSYTATAWYHHRLSQKISQKGFDSAVNSSQYWALGSYLSALVKGSKISKTERKSVIDSLCYYTGLDSEFIIKHELRIDRFSFAEELLSKSGYMVGILDGRVKSPILSRWNPYLYDDPSNFVISGPLTSGINSYLRINLKYSTDLEYIILSEKVNSHWNYSSSPTSQGYVNVTPDLRESMCINSRMRVLALMGYNDLTTPYFSQIYTFYHISQDSSLSNRITLKIFNSGHQIYTDSKSHEKMTADIESFINKR